MEAKGAVGVGRREGAAVDRGRRGEGRGVEVGEGEEE